MSNFTKVKFVVLKSQHEQLKRLAGALVNPETGEPVSMSFLVREALDYIILQKQAALFGAPNKQAVPTNQKPVVASPPEKENALPDRQIRVAQTEVVL